MPQAYQQEADVTRALCLEAGRAAALAARSPLHIEYKQGDGRSPVTNGDRLANQIVCDGLTKAFPQDAICAEESAESHAFSARGHYERVWCIDPIDGTREYIAGSGQWAVMVGLAVRGVAVFGAVYEALTDDLYMGAVEHDGEGEVSARWATVQRQEQVRPIVVSRQTDTKQCRLMVSRHSRSKALDALMAKLQMRTRMPLGSVGLKVSRLASAQAELYACLTDKIHEWDACGPAALLMGAGGEVTDLNGAALRYNKQTTPMRSGLLASNGYTHKAALTVLREAKGSLPYLAHLMGQKAD